MAPSKLPAVSYWQPWSTRDPFKARSTLPHMHLAQRASVTPARHQRRSALDTSVTHRWYHNGSQLDEDLSIKPANSLRKRTAIIIRIVANLMAVAKQFFRQNHMEQDHKILQNVWIISKSYLEREKLSGGVYSKYAMTKLPGQTEISETAQGWLLIRTSI